MGLGTMIDARRGLWPGRDGGGGEGCGEDSGGGLVITTAESERGWFSPQEFRTGLWRLRVASG